jgi:hypothetical protein
MAMSFATASCIDEYVVSFTGIPVDGSTLSRVYDTIMLAKPIPGVSFKPVVETQYMNDNTKAKFIAWIYAIMDLDKVSDGIRAVNGLLPGDVAMYFNPDCDNGNFYGRYRDKIAFRIAEKTKTGSMVPAR